MKSRKEVYRAGHGRAMVTVASEACRFCDSLAELLKIDTAWGKLAARHRARSGSTVFFYGYVRT